MTILEQLAKEAELRVMQDKEKISFGAMKALAEALPKKDFEETILFDDVASGKAALDDFIAQLTDEELAYLMVGNSVDNVGFNSVLGAAAKTLPGAAGETTGKLEEK